jgi:hypothetical protein
MDIGTSFFCIRILLEKLTVIQLSKNKKQSYPCNRRGPLSLVSKIEELLERKNSSSGQKNQDYGRKGCALLTTRHLSIRRSWR